MTLSPIVTDCNALHSLNAFSPILVTPLPIITEPNTVFPLNIPSIIVVLVPRPIVTVCTALSLMKSTSQLVTLSGIVNVSKEVQPSNAFAPIVVTLFPIVTEFNAVQPLNVAVSILVTLLPIVTDCNIMLSSNALELILVTLLGILYETFELPLGYCIKFVLSKLNNTLFSLL